MFSTKRDIFFWRRLAVLAAAALLILGGALVWFAGKKGAAPQKTDSVQLPDGTFDTSAERDAKANQKSKECGAGDITVVAITDKNSYGPDEKPLLSLSVENTSDSPCYKNLGTSQLLFEIQTGAQTVWVSTDCQTNPDDRYVLLQPQQKLTTKPFEWDRSFSDPETCDLDRDKVIAAGAAYHLLVAVGSTPAQRSSQFLLY